MAQVVQHLFCKDEALSSNSSSSPAKNTPASPKVCPCCVNESVLENSPCLHWGCLAALVTREKLEGQYEQKTKHKTEVNVLNKHVETFKTYSFLFFFF
jgi:hypothetical protein